MSSTRRFLLGLIAAAVAVALIRGLVVGWVFHLSAPTTARVVRGHLVLAGLWVPCGLAALRIFEASSMSRVERVAALVCVGSAAILIEPVLMPYVGSGPVRMPPYFARVIGRSDTNLVFWLAVVAAAAAAAARNRHLASVLTSLKLESAVADAQLHVLTLQLHPHFLFNALNLVSQLAFESVPAARHAIDNLRSLLAESLRHAFHREVSLGEELRFVRAYLEIQEARFRGRLFSAIDVASDAELAAVPHLLLQPLVENAIVHGLSSRAVAGHLELTARRTGHTGARLFITIRDDGVGPAGPVREGLGIGNARLRLERLFAGDFRLELTAAPGGGTIVTVDLPFRAIATHQNMMDADLFLESDSHAVGDIAAPVAPVARSARTAVFVVWIGIAFLWTELRTIAEGGLVGFDWSSILLSSALNAGLWLALTPVVVRFARWVSLDGGRSRRFVVAHACGAVVAAVLHTGLWMAVLRLTHSSDFQPIVRSMFGWMLWDIAAYAVVVSITTFIGLSERIRDIHVVVAARRARLAKARLAALRLRLQPRVLLGALDALERVVSIDAARSEAAITRMGDLLRLLLARSEQEWVDVDEEVELLMAYLDVVNAWRADAHALSVSVATDCGEAQMPAMLLPTLAAAIGGTLRELWIGERDAAIVVHLTASEGTTDSEAVAELSERLAQLYRGAERLISGCSDDVRFIHIEFPVSESARVDPPEEGYALASA